MTLKRSLGAALVVIPLAFAASTASAPIARMPGPAPIVRSYDPVTVNAQCEGCHSAIAAEWRSSLHHLAWSDPPFQRALAREPDPFCRGCHAPEANPLAPEPARAAIGIGCVTCHTLDRAPLAIPKADGTSAPHPVAREARFASDAACAGCHEFEFPDHDKRVTPLFLQSTVTEHARSPAAATRCAGCHMPVVGAGAAGAHRSHRFAASRDEVLVRSAVTVAAIRSSPTRVVITLTAGPKLGHAFPTGDLFRRISIEASSDGAKVSKWLGRHFGPRQEKPGVTVRAELADDRVEPGKPRAVDLSLPQAAGKAIAWRVVYERVEAAIADDGHDAIVEGSIELGAGTL